MEIWIDIKGYEGKYEVSSFGRVRSFNYRNTGEIKVLSVCENKCGYLYVGLFKDGKQKKFKIHRLVAESFIPNPNNLPQVNHKSEVKTDNRVENLEWCDAKYNSNYGTHNERITQKLTNGKRSKSVLQLTKNGELVREWPSTREASRKGYNNGGIYSCLIGKKKYYKGFIWKYKEVS